MTPEDLASVRSHLRAALDLIEIDAALELLDPAPVLEGELLILAEKLGVVEATMGVLAAKQAQLKSGELDVEGYRDWLARQEKLARETLAMRKKTEKRAA